MRPKAPKLVSTRWYISSALSDGMWTANSLVWYCTMPTDADTQPTNECAASSSAKPGWRWRRQASRRLRTLLSCGTDALALSAVAGAALLLLQAVAAADGGGDGAPRRAQTRAGTAAARFWASKAGSVWLPASVRTRLRGSLLGAPAPPRRTPGTGGGLLGSKPATLPRWSATSRRAGPAG
eukprot:TRINITY_DN3111_c0_g2_i1.p2 TRINITY_DN3111_c0_g2~~TRINITY_DN3111_c0_g2_i1.p2  ORF type:complete len:181 (+),score=46.65 TRINITY_DN3111_c0_g2_i1:293-835(+)